MKRQFCIFGAENQNQLNAAKLYLLLSIFLLTGLLAQAQVGDIRDKSRDNQDNKGNNSGSNSKGPTGGSGADDGGSCGGACLNLGCTILSSAMFEGMLLYHQSIVDKRDEVPRALSFDAMLQVAGNPGNYYAGVPRIRGNWGLFSTDIRYVYLIEPSAEYTSTYQTFDWQIIQFNFIQAPNVNFYMGTGLMYEQFSATWFNEHSVGLNFFASEDKYMMANEFRFTPDYNTNVTVRWEGSSTLNYRFYESPHAFFYASGGVLYQKYFDSVDIWGVFGGIRLNLH